MPAVIKRLSKGEELPEGAVRLASDEAFKVQEKLFLTWKPDSDVRAIFMGPQIMMLSTTMSAYYINYYYRQAFRIPNPGRFVSYIAVLSVPTFVSIMTYRMSSYESLMLGRSKCHPTREGAKLGLRQVLLATGYPLVTSSLAAIYYSILSGSMALPQFVYPLTVSGCWEHARSMSRIWSRESRGLRVPFMGLITIQMLGCIALTHLQVKEVDNVQKKLTQRMAAGAAREGR